MKKLMFLFLAVQLFGQSMEVTSDHWPVYEEIKEPSIEKGFFYFCTLSYDPGIGLSVRQRAKRFGSAVDMKLGIYDQRMLVIYGSSGSKYSPAPDLSVDYNFLAYLRKQEASLYGSAGLGIIFCPADNFAFPYVPLRVGFQFERGFVDVGARNFFLYAFPELRTGLSF